jgi:hypothetical protein
MNSLVALGTCTAFSLAALATAFPALNWDAYCSEEPVMLLAFVLLGRSLERQARLRAATDLQALATLTPPTARLLLEAAAAAEAVEAAEGQPLVTVEVPSDALRVGDVVQVRDTPARHGPRGGGGGCVVGIPKSCPRCRRHPPNRLPLSSASPEAAPSVVGIPKSCSLCRRHPQKLLPLSSASPKAAPSIVGIPKSCSL